MKDQFYYKVRGKVRGPVQFGVLAALLRNGELTPDDSVRTPGSNEWQRAGIVMSSLIARFPQATNSPEAKDSDRKDSPSTMTRTRSTRRSVSKQVFAAALVEGLFAAVGNVVESLFLFVAHVCRSAFGSIQKKHVIVFLGVVGLIALNIFFYYQSRPPYQEEIASYKALGGLWGEIRRLRTEEAPPEDWASLHSTVQPKIDTLVSELEQDATTTNQVRMQLLWASRDFLPQMFSDAREEVSNSETLFAAHMNQTAKLLAKAGQPIAGF